MAHKKGAGSSKNGRESHSKRLGVKIFGGQQAVAGNIIVRQRGTKHHPDVNVGMGKDHTLFALIDGKVVFRKKANNKSFVSVLPIEEVAAPVAPVQDTKAAPKKVAKPAKAKETGAKSAKGDDLTVIEGIGPKIAAVLVEAGITQFADLAAKSAEEIKAIVVEGGVNVGVTDTWPEQAKFAAEGKFEELKKWQEELNGGRKAE